jgi:hypothetical protein
MRKAALLIALLALSSSALAQSPDSDDALLTKARHLYDAPFTRNLVSFDCAVQFDWKNHFQVAIGSVPPAAVPIIDQLQTIPHRVFVDRSGATVSAIPKAPDLSAIPHSSELEQALNSIVTGGINAWIPFATNVILPIKPTKFAFQRSDVGYKVTMNGNGVNATLLLDSDLRLESVESQLPQQMQFDTRFADGPNGYLLGSVTTIMPTGAGSSSASKFDYKFQTLQSFQLPSEVIVTPANSEVWHFSLTDCKIMTGITIKVDAPPTVR